MSLKKVHWSWISLGLILSSFSFFHAIYISVIEIDHEDGALTGVMKIKVFENDLSDAVYNWTEIRIEATPDGFQELAPINEYFMQNAGLSTNGNPNQIEVVSVERLDDAVWLECRFETPAHWKEVAIRAPFFTELFPTQINVVKIQNGDDKRFARLSPQKQEVTFNF